MEERESCLVWHLLPGSNRERSPKSPGKENGFLVVLWVAVRPEGVAGVVAAARYVMAVSGGLCSHFWHCCTALLSSSWWCGSRRQQPGVQRGAGLILGIWGLLSNRVAPV